jgi:hypothetical protein
VLVELRLLIALVTAVSSWLRKSDASVGVPLALEVVPVVDEVGSLLELSAAQFVCPVAAAFWAYCKYHSELLPMLPMLDIFVFP